MPQLEVLDVDAGRAERLRDAREHARLVRDAHADPVQLRRVGAVRVLEHARARGRRLADPGLDRVALAVAQRALDLGELGAQLGQGGGDEIAVVDEDVRPDGRVRAGDARHLAQRRARVAERVLAGARGRAHEQVRERVREMARDREQAVVLGRVEPHGARADRRDEALDEIDARVVRDGRRGEEPDGAVEEIGARASGAAGCAACEGMACDEARILDGARARASSSRRR